MSAQEIKFCGKLFQIFWRTETMRMLIQHNLLLKKSGCLQRIAICRMVMENYSLINLNRFPRIRLFQRCFEKLDMQMNWGQVCEILINIQGFILVSHRFL